MKKKISSLFLILIIALTVGISINYKNDGNYFISKNSPIAALMNKKIEIDEKHSEEKDLTPIFFNFLSGLIYKFAQ